MGCRLRKAEQGEARKEKKTANMDPRKEQLGNLLHDLPTSLDAPMEVADELAAPDVPEAAQAELTLAWIGDAGYRLLQKECKRLRIKPLGGKKTTNYRAALRKHLREIAAAAEEADADAAEEQGAAAAAAATRAAAAAARAEQFSIKGLNMSNELCGRRVQKFFPGHGLHVGTVAGYHPGPPPLYYIEYGDGDGEDVSPRDCRRLILAGETFVDTPMPEPCKFVDGKYKKDPGGSTIEVRPVDSSLPFAAVADASDGTAAAAGADGVMLRDEIFQHRRLQLWVNEELIFDRCEQLEWVTKRDVEHYLVDHDGLVMRVPPDVQTNVLEQLEKLAIWSSYKGRDLKFRSI